MMQMKAKDVTETLTESKSLIELIEKLSGKRVTLQEAYPSQIDSISRPSKMKRPDISRMTKSATSYWRDLYIQDEARDILVDKYGKERGEKTFNGLVDSRGGAFYQAVTEIVMEKYKMLQELVNAGIMTREEAFTNNYFDHSYYAVWTEWMNEVVKKPYAHLIKDKEEVKPTEVPVKVEPVIEKKPILTVSGYDDKDADRINDLVSRAKTRQQEETFARVMANKITDWKKAARRGNAAEGMNYHNLAQIFFNRAEELQK